MLVEASFNPNMPFKWNATRIQVLPNQRAGGPPTNVNPPQATPVSVQSKQAPNPPKPGHVNPTATLNNMAFSSAHSVGTMSHQLKPGSMSSGGGGSGVGGGGTNASHRSEPTVGFGNRDRDHGRDRSMGAPRDGLRQNHSPMRGGRMEKPEPRAPSDRDRRRDDRRDRSESSARSGHINLFIWFNCF